MGGALTAFGRRDEKLKDHRDSNGPQASALGEGLEQPKNKDLSEF